MRPRLHTIDLTTESPVARVAVELDLPGRAPLRGTATDAATAAGQARAGAQATIAALRELLPQVRLVLDEVVVHQGVEGRWVTVLATALGRVGVERLVGSALVEGGVHRAAVHATLQACNRRLGHPADGDPAAREDQAGGAAATGSPEPVGWRDPMAVLLGTLRLLRRHVDELDDTERLGLLDAGIAAADRLVGTLGGAPAPAAASRQSCRVETVVARAAASVAEPGRVRVDCPSDVHAAADADDLHRLVATGLDAVRRQVSCPVAVDVVVAGPWVQITVHADDEVATELADGGRAADPRTAGLGLEVVRLLAEANGGAATIDGVGSTVQTVRVRLPVA